jgi:hypothetical protein
MGDWDMRLRTMSHDEPKAGSKFSWRNFLLVMFLLGLWLLGAISGMLFFNLLDFVHFRPKGHILILILLVIGSLLLMTLSYLLFPRQKERNEGRERNEPIRPPR